MVSAYIAYGLIGTGSTILACAFAFGGREEVDVDGEEVLSDEREERVGLFQNPRTGKMIIGKGFDESGRFF